MTGGVPSTEDQILTHIIFPSDIAISAQSKEGLFELTGHTNGELMRSHHLTILKDGEKFRNLRSVTIHFSMGQASTITLEEFVRETP